MCMIIINVTPVTIYYIIIILCHVGFWFIINKYLYIYIYIIRVVPLKWPRCYLYYFQTKVL